MKCGAPEDLALAGRVEMPSGQNAQERGLARAVGTDEQGAAPASDVHRHISEYVWEVGVEAEVQVWDRDHWCVRHPCLARAWCRLLWTFYVSTPLYVSRQRRETKEKEKEKQKWL